MSTPNLSLWDIESALHELMDARDEAVGEEEIAVVDKALAEYVSQEVTKVDRIRSYLRHCLDMQNAARQEMERQKARMEAWERREKVLRKLVLLAMQAFGKKKLEGRTGTLAVVTNGGKTPVVIDREEDIPIMFKPAVVTYPVNKDMLRAALEGGREVKGAHLGPRGVHLEIK